MFRIKPIPGLIPGDLILIDLMMLAANQYHLLPPWIICTVLACLLALATWSLLAMIQNAIGKYRSIR